ncbi:hypothetical protein FUAX_37040 [Fulvitalea axinellae]|uniref:HTH araC/xylS-type domain-containing protein n=1 Tax=Fulvitalea axinellae TaxID=1182444 RepID=A0AAU9D0R3_9BACT|nr:hypothetical protein FUAX_37040 [Fulvitalea axinellae]
MLSITEDTAVDQAFSLRRVEYEVGKEVSRATDYHKIIFLEQADGFYYEEGNRKLLSAPGVYWLKPGEALDWEFTGSGRGVELTVSDDWVSQEGEEHETALGRILELRHVVLEADTWGELDGLLAELEKEFSLIDFGSVSCARHLFWALVFRVCGLLDKVKREEQTGPPALNLVRRFQGLIGERFLDYQKVREYAVMLGITPQYLNEISQKGLGMTASEAIRQRLLTESKWMLLYSDMHVSDIASSLGFSDTSHFGKFFKGYEVLTPTAYRKGFLTK